VLNRIPAVLQISLQYIIEKESPEISYVGVVPDRRTTTVHSNLPRLDGFEGAFGAARRVVELDAHLLTIDGLR
jgi:hypothetical protein